MIRAIHDVKGIDIGNSLVRYKAELDFDGRELTRSYLDKQDLTLLLEVSGTIMFKKNGPTRGGYKCKFFNERFTRVNSMRSKAMQC